MQVQNVSNLSACKAKDRLVLDKISMFELWEFCCQVILIELKSLVKQEISSLKIWNHFCDSQSLSVIILYS